MGIGKILKVFLKKCIYGEDASSETLINFLRSGGAKIGEGVTVYVPNKTMIDKTAPWLLEIGNNVRIAEGVKILTHDYSWSVLKCCDTEDICPGQILGAESAVIIGNNVFVGMNAVITRGVTIGDNVVIGAGSIVTKNCESNAVYAGNPAKRIMSIEEFYRKRKDRQFEEAKAIAIRYRECFGKEPPIELFREYFMLFLSADEAIKIDKFRAQMMTSGNYEQCFDYMSSQTPVFRDYNSFLRACYGEDECN